MAYDLHRRHLRAALREHRGVNIALAAMVAVSACLMASGAMLMERLVGAIDALIEQAQPPHVLQMHRGEYDRGALDSFAAAHPEIDSWLIEDMIGFDGAAIAWEHAVDGVSGDMSDSVMDNLLVTQNEAFDFLIDRDGAVPHPGPGEVYVPVAYEQRYELSTGDQITVLTGEHSYTFTVAGFVRDSQMASSLSASTRFLVSEDDFAQMAAAGVGAPEIIVEYRLHDPAQAPALEQAYAADDRLPRNGESVTYAMLRMIHAISDGLAGLALMALALVLVAIALINVRFVIRGRVEADLRQIAAMKAIGLPEPVISRLYLAPVVVLTIVGCLVGGGLAVPAQAWLTRDLHLAYGVPDAGLLAVVVPVLAVAVVAAIVIGTCSRLLRGLRRIPLVQALVHGTTRRQPRRQYRLRGLFSSHLDLRLALVDLRSDRRQWVLVPIVFTLAALLMMVPTHLYTTLTSPSVATQMGVPDRDVRIDVHQSEEIEELRTRVVERMAADEAVTDVVVLERVIVEVDGPQGWQAMTIERGDHDAAVIEYTAGREPGHGEIALSALNAEELGVGTGDTVQVRAAGAVRSLTVSGVYDDVTSGGDTAKTSDDLPGPNVAYVIYADVADATDPAAVAARYQDEFPTIDAIGVEDYTRQTLSHLTQAIGSTAVLASVGGVVIAALIMAMFLQLRLAQQRRVLGVKAGLGFTAAQIIAQMRWAAVLAATAGAVVGALAGLGLGGPVVSSLMAALGVGLTGMRVVVEPVWVAVLLAALVLAACAVAFGTTARLRRSGTQLWLRSIREGEG